MKNFESIPRPAAALPVLDFAAEDHRLDVLQSYGPDSLQDDPELATISRFAAKLCDAPIALVSLVERERQRFLAHEGLEVSETPRSVSFCDHAMREDGIMQVRDARADERFAANGLVTAAPHIRFYAGVPLVSEEGAPLGTLCIIDSQPRPEGLSELQLEGLEVLAQAVMRRLRARREGLIAERRQLRGVAELRALADSIPAIAWSADGEGRMDYFNRRLVEYTGSEAGSYGEAIHPEDAGDAGSKWKEALRTGQPYECEHRFRRKDGEWRWMMTRAEPVKDEYGRVVRWFGTATDIDHVHKLSESRDLLARELSHRIKNIFAVVSGLVSLSTRKKPEFKAFGDELIGTIRALGRAHDYVRPAGSDRHSNSLHGMLSDLFLPYGSGDHGRVEVLGDDAAIAARAATPLALVFHELATNSAKYGALSTEEGAVELAIEDQGDTLLLRWTETGGPPLQGEISEGFGSRLVEMSVTGQLGGSWQRRFEESGMVCELTVSKASIAP